MLSYAGLLTAIAGVCAYGATIPAGGQEIIGPLPLEELPAVEQWSIAEGELPFGAQEEDPAEPELKPLDEVLNAGLFLGGAQLVANPLLDLWPSHTTPPDPTLWIAAAFLAFSLALKPRRPHRRFAHSYRNVERGSMRGARSEGLQAAADAATTSGRTLTKATVTVEPNTGGSTCGTARRSLAQAAAAPIAPQVTAKRKDCGGTRRAAAMGRAPGATRIPITGTR
jgi:hypothetical protein